MTENLQYLLTCVTSLYILLHINGYTLSNPRWQHKEVAIIIQNSVSVAKNANTNSSDR